MAACYSCPYFRRVREGKVVCELATIKPPDKQTFEEFVGSRCASEDGYKGCELYKIMNGYYERKYKR